MTTIKKVVVIGAGTMGQGIAQVCASAGYQTVLFDNDLGKCTQAVANIHQVWDGLVAKGKLDANDASDAKAALSAGASFNDCTGDLVIEAIVERLDIKRELFRSLEALNSDETILASNTSSLSLTEIGAGLAHPERFSGLHFFNPAPLMKLVEVIRTASSDQLVVERLVAFVVSLKKTPVTCSDSPGFIVNRVARPFYTESLKLAEEQAASLPAIDRLMEAAGFRLGPFKLMDLIGNDINFAVTSSLYNAFFQEPRFRPSRIQQQKVLAGHLGKKSGKGFYDYDQ